MCRIYSAQITSAIDNKLSGSTKESFDLHLTHCQQCYNEYTVLLSLKNRLGKLSGLHNPPEQLFQFMKTIPQQKEALSKIDSNERFELLQIDDAGNKNSGRMNIALLVAGIAATFALAGYYLISK